MSKPKFILASDGSNTAAIIDGILIGRGIRQLDFSTKGEEGDMRSTIKILDLDISTAELSTDTPNFMDWVNGE